MVREVGVEVQGGGGALKLASGGSIPGVPRGGRHCDPADRRLLGRARHARRPTPASYRRLAALAGSPGVPRGEGRLTTVGGLPGGQGGQRPTARVAAWH
jgi:hypothetical protein